MESLFLEALEEDLTEFERDVIEQAVEVGSISQSDYEEGMQRYYECMSEVDYEVELVPLVNDIIRVDPPRTSPDEVDALMAADYECNVRTALHVTMLFETQQGNPDLLSDPHSVVHQCLIDSGVVPENFAIEDVAALTGGGSGLRNAPFDVMEDRAQACLYGAGMSVAVAG